MSVQRTPGVEFLLSKRYDLDLSVSFKLLRSILYLTLEGKIVFYTFSIAKIYIYQPRGSFFYTKLKSLGLYYCIEINNVFMNNSFFIGFCEWWLGYLIFQIGLNFVLFWVLSRAVPSTYKWLSRQIKSVYCHGFVKRYFWTWRLGNLWELNIAK